MEERGTGLLKLDNNLKIMFIKMIIQTMSCETEIILHYQFYIMIFQSSLLEERLDSMYLPSFLENYFINLLHEEAEHADKTYREKCIIQIFQAIKILLFFCILWYWKLFKI